MLGSTYNPKNVWDFDKTKIQTNHQSATGTITSGQTGNIDLALADDHLLTGIQIICSNHSFGDKITLQVVDVSGTYYPAGTVLAQFATNITVRSDVQEVIHETSNYPAKILGGLTLRVIYASNGTLTPINIAVNYKLHMLLV